MSKHDRKFSSNATIAVFFAFLSAVSTSAIAIAPLITR
jgi:hypothetical protein